MSEDPSSDSTKRERERAGAGQVALVSTPAERGSECDGGRRAVSEPAVARAAASAGERVRRMHTEMPWLRSGWCGRSGGVAWVHAATRLREREQMASERAVPSATEKEFARGPVKNLNKTPLSHSTQARHRCELARASTGKEFSTKGGRTKRFTRQARQEKNWNPENEESTRRDGCAEKKKNICQTPFKGRVSRVLRYTLGAASPARSAFGAARRRRTAFTTRGVKRRRSHFVPRIGLRSPTHETAIAVRVQHVLLCTRGALNAALSAASAV